MDKIIEKYPAVEFDEFHMICPNHGIIYQKDMSNPVPYDEEYFQNYVEREKSPIAEQLNEFRVSFVEKYSKCNLDIGIGAGTFIKKCEGRVKSYGTDICPTGITWLLERELYINPYECMPSCIQSLTFWDSIEHFPDPSVILTIPKPGTFIFVSIPIFEDLYNAKDSHHFGKIGEHLYYWTADGLVNFIVKLGYILLEINDTESKLGRKQIKSFAFLRN